MITLDQVLLLQEKVESAVAKIAQLKAENDALRSKCAELTNALSAKTEQFSTFEADQSKIEHGILQALERLNAVENAVVQAAGAGEAPAAPVETTAQETPAEQASTTEEPAPIEQAAFEEQETASQAENVEASQNADVQQEPVAQEISQEATFAEATEPQIASSIEEAPQGDEQQGQFDIF